MPFSCASLSALKSGAITGSNLISATKRQKYGYTPLQSDPSAPPMETFLFTIEQDESVDLQAEITDHWVENNKSLADHIAIKPIQFTTKSFVSEVSTRPEGMLGELDEFVQEKLTVVNQYLPKLTAGATQILNSAKQALSVAKRAKDAAVGVYDKLAGNKTEDKTAQQVAFAKLRTYFQERTLFLVRTPWGQIENMAIERLHATQDGKTETMTEFEVTFKQINMAEAYAKKKIRGGRNATQAGGMKNLGSSTPTETATTWKDNMSKYASGLWDSVKSAWG